MVFPRNQGQVGTMEKAQLLSIDSIAAKKKLHPVGTEIYPRKIVRCPPSRRRPQQYLFYPKSLMAVCCKHSIVSVLKIHFEVFVYQQIFKTVYKRKQYFNSNKFIYLKIILITNLRPWFLRTKNTISYGVGCKFEYIFNKERSVYVLNDKLCLL